MNLAERFSKFEKMKFLKTIGVLSLLMLLMYSCKTSNQSGSIMENIHRKWMLVEYKDFTKDELVKLEANMDLTKNSEAPTVTLQKWAVTECFSQQNSTKEKQIFWCWFYNDVLRRKNETGRIIRKRFT
jgi:predicted SPOUT superfamily RNA methylase MTH1